MNLNFQHMNLNYCAKSIKDLLPISGTATMSYKRSGVTKH